MKPWNKHGMCLFIVIQQRVSMVFLSYSIFTIHHKHIKACRSNDRTNKERNESTSESIYRKQYSYEKCVYTKLPRHSLKHKMKYVFHFCHFLFVSANFCGNELKMHFHRFCTHLSSRLNQAGDHLTIIKLHFEPHIWEMKNPVQSVVFSGSCPLF